MNRIPRRRLLGALGAGGALGLLQPLAHAAAPRAGAQQVGVHRMRLGEFEVTTLLDGFLDLPPAVLMGDPEVVRQHLENAAIAPGTPVRVPVNTFLVNTGDRLVLVDTGGARLTGPTAGRLPQAFAAAGLDPAQVDVVCITHMHGDHLHGAVTPEGARLFPNATLRIAKADVDYWANPEVEAKAPENQKGRFVAAKRAVAAYGDRLQTFTPGDEIVPGVRSVPAAGHTPGHCCYLVESGGAKLLLVGDLLHVAPVQFPRPEITVGFDWNQDAARAARQAILKRAVDERMLVGAVHVAFPGIGRVRASGSGYAFDPLPWQLF